MTQVEQSVYTALINDLPEAEVPVQVATENCKKLQMIKPSTPMCALILRYPVLESSVTNFVGRAGVPVQPSQANFLYFGPGWVTCTDPSGSKKF